MAETLTRPVKIVLPDSVVKELEMTARQQRRSLSEVIEEIILQGQHHLPPLPDDVEAELAALTKLSDEVLWLLARETLSKAEQEELADLNSDAKQRSLNAEEDERREELLQLYDRTMVRRAQAASLLQSRGYDISDPTLLQK